MDEKIMNGGFKMEETNKTTEQVKDTATNVKEEAATQSNGNNNENGGSGLGGIISLIILIVTLIWINPFGCGRVENEDLAIEACQRKLTNNVFMITPREDQIKVKAIDGKDGNVLVEVKIKDDDLLEYSLYGDEDVIYYGYVPASGGRYYSYWGTDKGDVKDKMGW